jgi:hypothetical protein
MTADRPDWLPAELYPFESHHAQIDGASVHYIDEGTGPPLLLLHGNPTWSFLYRDLIKGLRDRYRCIAPDHPGFGLSRAAAGYGASLLPFARWSGRRIHDPQAQLLRRKDHPRQREPPKDTAARCLSTCSSSAAAIFSHRSLSGPVLCRIDLSRHASVDLAGASTAGTATARPPRPARSRADG